MRARFRVFGILSSLSYPDVPVNAPGHFFFFAATRIEIWDDPIDGELYAGLSAQLLVKSHHPRRQRVMALLPWYVHSSEPVTDTSMLWHLAEDLCLAHWREQPAFLITFISALTCMMKSREQTQTSKTRL